MSSDPLLKEAGLFARYITRREPDDLSVHLYERAIRLSKMQLSKKDEKLLQFVLRNNWSLGLLDAGLAMFRKNSAVRQRLFMMYAILESSPLYCDHFLPKKRSKIYLFTVLWAGTRGVFKALTGGLLLKFI